MKKSRKELLEYTKNLTLLVIDDSTSTCAMYKIAFSKLFKNVIEAYDGNEGYDAFINNKIDLILTDHMMPNLSGIDMTKKIRQVDAEIPIILVTATKETEDLVDAINLRINSFISKPIEMDEVYDAIAISIQSVIIKQLENKAKNQEFELLQYREKYNKTQHDAAFQKELHLIGDDLYSKYLVSNGDILFFSTYYRPLDTLSGDIYSIREISDEKVFMFIIDAMGKGVSASVTTVLSIAFINHMVNRAGSDFTIERAIKDYVEFIHKKILDEEIVSAMFALIDTKTDMMKLARFSMPAVLGIDSDGNMKHLGNSSLPITSYYNDYSIEEIDISSYERMLFFSDGLVESSVGENSLYNEYIEEDFRNSNCKNDFVELANGRVENPDDDTTLIFFQRFHNSDAKKEFKFITKMKELERASEELSKFFDDLSIAEDVRVPIEQAFSELIMNAYEHGNIGITLNEKNSLLESGEYYNYLLQKELNCDKIIDVKFYLTNTKDTERLIIKISDEGDGFDTETLRSHLVNGTAFNGRGILMSKMAVNGVFYSPKGNEVIIIHHLEK